MSVKRKMSMKKKGIALWLALLLGVSSLSGCGSGNGDMTQLSEKGAEILNSSDEDSDQDVEPLKTKTKLPEDGVITQAQMETIAGKDEKYYFVGKTESGISYKWTYNGSQKENLPPESCRTETSGGMYRGWNRGNKKTGKRCTVCIKSYSGKDEPGCTCEADAYSERRVECR